MPPFKLAYFSATGTEVSSLSQAASRCREQGGDLTVTARTRTQLSSQAQIEAFVREALTADLVILTLHGGLGSCPVWEPFITAIRERRAAGQRTPHLHVQPVGGDEEALLLAQQYADGWGQDIWDTLSRYLTYGGPQNYCQLLNYARNFLHQDTVPVLPPAPVPQEGIYHPDFATVPSLEEYLAARIASGRPTVGIWFYQTYWLNQDLAFIDALIREAERQGANALAVFHVRYPNKLLGNRPVPEIVRDYFLDGDRPRIDVLLNPMMFSLALAQPAYAEVLPRLNVPFLQAITMYTPRARWEESLQGLATMEVSYAVAQPEFDGALISVPIAGREELSLDPVTGALVAKLLPIPDRVSKLVSLALNWAKLRRKPNREKKVAVIFHQYPPRNDRIGVAVGLDSFASIKLLLEELAARGYRVDRQYGSGEELAQELLAHLTYDRRWLPDDQQAARSEAGAGPEQYLPWHQQLPARIRDKMVADWGPPPGELCVHNGRLYFAGVQNGNIFLTLQPPRGFYENTAAIIHDPHLSPPHLYLMKYRWLKEVFGADAVIHVGKHGSLEWLPGKALGLSATCYPDLAIMDLPNIYPYIINDPSEGTQAKRRSYCGIVDHLPPPFTNADLYEDLARVENLLRDYVEAEREDPNKLPVLRQQLWEAVVAADLDKDLEITAEAAMADFPGFLQQLHAYLDEVADTMISDGLHILGVPPAGEQLVEFLVQLTRLPNGEVPSLREALVTALGFDYEDILAHRGDRLPHYDGQTGGADPAAGPPDGADPGPPPGRHRFPGRPGAAGNRSPGLAPTPGDRRYDLYRADAGPQDPGDPGRNRGHP